MNKLVLVINRILKMVWKIIEFLVRFFLTPILNILHVQWSESQWKSFLQFVRFGMVGVTNVCVSYSINILMITLLRPFDITYDYVIANITAFLLSVLWSYLWNSKHVFVLQKGAKRSKVRTLLRTYAAYAFTGIFLNNILATIWIRGLGISRYISPLMNLPISIPTNFLINKFWAYKEE